MQSLDLMVVGVAGSGAQVVLTAVVGSTVVFCLATFEERECLGTTEFPIRFKSGIEVGAVRNVKRTLKAECSSSVTGRG